jgi:hypothetical protein
VTVGCGAGGSANAESADEKPSAISNHGEVLRHRMAEQRHQSVAQLLGDFASHIRDRRRGHIEITANQITPFFGIEPCRNPVESTRSLKSTVTCRR